MSNDLNMEMMRQSTGFVREGTKFGITIGQDFASAEQKLLSKGRFFLDSETNAFAKKVQVTEEESPIWFYSEANPGDVLMIYRLRDWRRMVIWLGVTQDRVTMIAWSANWIDL